jgi:uracil-DNA glycosylase family 4
MSLLDLYKKNENPECQGCKILSINKPFHCYKDYVDLSQSDILFLVDSFQFNGFEGLVLSEQTEALFNDVIGPLLGNIKYTISASVKCPQVQDKHMDAESMKVCRKYLEETVEAVKPKLIIPMGNLAFKMLMKKSGIEKNHGSEFNYNEIPVIPTYSLSILFIEPKYRDVIISDVSLALNKIIHKSITPLKLRYSVVKDLQEFKQIISTNSLDSTDEAVSVDIETNGLNFLTDKILTISISYKDAEGVASVVIPIYHRESPFLNKDKTDLYALINSVTGNPNNIKVLQNAKFDYKFLDREGILLENIWDTAGMAHLIDENQNTKLINLVKRYFPENLEVL